MSQPRIFVAQPIPQPAIDIMKEVADVTVYPYLDRQIGVDELAAAARRSDWLFVLHETNVTAEVLEANPNLRGVAAMAKFDPNIDFDAARRLRIPIIVEDPKDNAFGGVTETTADLTVGMLLGLAYRIVEADRFSREGRFKQEQTMELMGVGCHGKTVGMIGLGKIGVHMAARLKPFGLRSLYTKRVRLEPERERDLGVEWRGDIDAVLQESHFVCILCDYNPSTHKLIGRRELDILGPASYLINTARGRIVDEADLIDALREKRIAGAALDVFWDEPPLTQDPRIPEELCAFKNVILAPHNGGATIELRTHRTVNVARFLAQMIRTGSAPFILNREIYESGGNS